MRLGGSGTTMSNTVTLEQLKATGRLPSPAGVALEVFHLANKEDSSIQEISKILHTDPALTGKVVKYANSSFVGSRRPVMAVDDAIVRLGLRKVVQLALGFSVLAGNKEGRCEAFDYPVFWSCSLATAVGFRTVSSRRKISNPEEAFTCGLLSQIGSLALASVYPAEYAEILKDWKNGKAGLCALEDDALSITHNELTGLLFKDWGLPDIFVRVVEGYEDPVEYGLQPDAREFKLALSLKIAHQWAMIIAEELQDRRSLIPDLFSMGESAGFDRDALVELCDEIVPQWVQMGQIFDIDAKEIPSLKELEEKAEQLQVEIAVEAEAADETDGEPLCILVVENDPDQLLTIKSLLENEGHTVFTAQNGKEALTRVVQVKPQLVITDWLMAEMDGVEFCKTLRQSDAMHDLFVIMLTVVEDKDRMFEALKAGVDDYIRKPIDGTILLARIREAARVIRLQRENKRQVQEIERSAADLSRINRKLEKALKVKSEFLANMSHELRTPMNAIAGMLNILQGTPLTDEQKNYIQIAFDGTKTLLMLVNDILDLSKVEAGKLELEHADFDLAEVVELVVDMLKHQASQKHLGFSCMIDPSVPVNLRGDSLRLQQILMNLVSNAIKFTEKGEVLIKVVTERDHAGYVVLKFSVHDTGIGISKDATGRLFQFFSQADSSMTRRYGGTGLGLAISKLLTEKMNGKIGVESTEGKGSKFWFTACLEKRNESMNVLLQKAGTLKGKRVLLADSHRLQRRILNVYLTACGCECVEAETKENLLAIIGEGEAKQAPIDLVIIDRKLTAGDWKGFVGKHVKILRPERIKYVLTVADEPEKSKWSRAPTIFSGIVEKPLKRSQLFAALTTCFKKEPRL